MRQHGHQGRVREIVRPIRRSQVDSCTTSHDLADGADEEVLIVKNKNSQLLVYERKAHDSCGSSLSTVSKKSQESRLYCVISA
jgi:hypothetical protein